ncbi:MAG: DNA-binding protein [Desulfobacterales bacterium]|nr:DNA-binding protein [Desulfobacterales bacterium]
MEDLTGKVFLKQAELAERWGCSQGTIINYRNKGLISFFQLPESTKVLYPVSEILEIERKYTKNASKTKGGDSKKAETKKVKPCVSAPKKEWRI